MFGGIFMNPLWVTSGIGIIALIFSFLTASWIGKKEVKDKKLNEISSYIQDGAMAFLKKEYRYLAVFIVIVFAAISIF